MKILIAGNAVVVESTITNLEMEQAAKFAPSALVIVDDNDNEAYRVSQGAVASVSKYGVQFDGFSADGNMTATLLLGHTEDKVEAAKETYGVALAALSHAEAIVKDEIAMFTRSVEDAFANVVVAGAATNDTETEA